MVENSTPGPSIDAVYPSWERMLDFLRGGDYFSADKSAVEQVSREIGENGQDVLALLALGDEEFVQYAGALAVSETHQLLVVNPAIPRGSNMNAVEAVLGETTASRAKNPIMASAVRGGTMMAHAHILKSPAGEEGDAYVLSPAGLEDPEGLLRELCKTRVNIEHPVAVIARGLDRVAGDARNHVQQLMEGLPPGSSFAAAHLVRDNSPREVDALVEGMNEVLPPREEFDGVLVARSASEFRGIFDGLDLLAPSDEFLPEGWRSEGSLIAREAAGTVLHYAGIGIKPD